MSSAEDLLSQLIGPVSRETLAALHAFETLLRRWNATTNLVSPSDVPDLWERHIVDSAQLLPLAPDAHSWLDLGSGGGFPGVVLAILLAGRPGAGVTLVESNQKKASFLRTALRECGASGQVLPARIEALSLPAVPDIVTARALAPLGKLLELSAPWLSKGSIGLFHKGRDYRSEVEESRNQWDFDLIEHRSRIDDAAAILEIRNLTRRRAA